VGFSPPLPRRLHVAQGYRPSPAKFAEAAKSYLGDNSQQRADNLRFSERTSRHSVIAFEVGAPALGSATTHGLESNIKLRLSFTKEVTLW
jgi:hypothetical protein